MTETFASIKIKTLESRLKGLSEEYEAAGRQLSHTLSDVDRLRIQRQMAAIEEEILKVEAELRPIALADTVAPARDDGFAPPPALAGTSQVAKPDAAHAGCTESRPTDPTSRTDQNVVNAKNSAIAIGDHANAANTRLDLRGASIETLTLYGENKGESQAKATARKRKPPQSAVTPPD